MDTPLKLKPSSHVKSAKYDAGAERLTLELNNGTFAIHGVPPAKAAEYAASDSHGNFFFKNFAKGQHEITRIK